jgi:hypothetical protein
MDYKIFIISFNRVETCYKKTLTMLKENQMPRELIHLVVYDIEQKQMYEKEIPTDYYNSIIVTKKHDGVYGQMNFILQKEKKGQHILNLDDDITCIYELKVGKLVKSHRLQEIIKEGFALCEQKGYKLFGFYPVANPFYMKNDYSTNLKFIVGAFMGIINEKITLELDVKIKADYLYCIKSYLNNGGIIRFNNI